MIDELLIDSRTITRAKGGLFIALVGPNHDAHQHLREAYEKGARHFLISDANAKLDELEEADVLLVEDTLGALQVVAAWHREQFAIPLIGITGSNGKTVVKEWLHQLLQDDEYIVRSPKSFNSQVGVPLSVWRMREAHQLAIFEAGISTVGEMARLEKILSPSVGILTHIGPAHDEGFSSTEEKIREKLSLFLSSRLLIYNGSEERITKELTALREANAEHYHCSCLCWRLLNINEEKQAEVAMSRQSAKGHDLGTYTLRLPLPYTDDASVENALHVAAYLWHAGYTEEAIAQKLPLLRPLKMRLEVKSAINGATLINDAYSNDLDSLKIALNLLSEQRQHKKHTVILSDLLESGLPESIRYERIADLLRAHGVKRLIGIGSEMKQAHAVFETIPDLETAFFERTSDFLIGPPDFEQEAILLKGARSFTFERIAHYIEQQQHATVLRIHMNAIEHNLNIYRKLLPDNTTKIMVMVKAFAYGSGSAEVARLLQFHKVDYLGVAYVDEGVALREAGIQLPIMVMNPDPLSFDTCMRYRIEPEIYSMRLLEQWLQTQDVVEEERPQDAPTPIHLKIETGMHRLGFDDSNFEALLSFLNEHATALPIASIFTHLAASDEAAHDDFSRQQLTQFTQRYERILKLLREKGCPSPMRHVLNSSGIARFGTTYQFEMVRLGIGLYGIDPSAEVQDQLQEVGRLSSYISQIKTLETGQTIGYGRSAQAEKPLRTATVAIGYGDGLRRSLSQGKGTLLLNGKTVPIIGKVCMDMCMIDISDFEEEEVKVGQEVLVFGKERPIQELALQMDTISYEVLTNISPRVKRVYEWE